MLKVVAALTIGFGFGLLVARVPAPRMEPLRVLYPYDRDKVMNTTDYFPREMLTSSTMLYEADCKTGIMRRRLQSCVAREVWSQRDCFAGRSCKPFSCPWDVEQPGGQREKPSFDCTKDAFSVMRSASSPLIWPR